MKLIKLVVFCIFLNTTLQAQQYFSKMFDVNNRWESFIFPINKKNNELILSGTSINFFVNDSTKFRSVIIVKLDSSLNIINKTELREPYKSYTYLIPIKDIKNEFVFGLLDTNNRISYKILSLNDLNVKSFKTINFSYTTSLTNNDIFNTNNKLYFFCADYTTFVASKLKLSMQCMDTNGNLLWGKVFQDKRCYTNNAVQTKDGNFLLAGLKYYGEGPGGDDSAFAWYAKVDTLGNILWEKDMIRGSAFLADDLWAGNANGDIYLSGSLLAFQGNTPIDLHRDSSYCTIAKIDEKTGNIIWYKQLFTERRKIQGLFSVIKPLNYHKGSLYALVDHFASEQDNPNRLSQYVMLTKFDLQGNILWKRLFSNWYLSNRAYSLTPIDDGFLICGDAKDSTHEKGDSDAWLIKTDTNGCIIPGCNAKDGIVQIINPEKVFTVFPNPAQNEINVETNFDTGNYQNIKLSKFYIYNLQGQILLTKTANNQYADKIETNNLANGTYLVVIELSNGSQAVKKVVIAH